MKKRGEFIISPGAIESLESRIALRLAARLTERTQDIGVDISERLRVARERALERARLAHAATPATSNLGVTTSGAAVLGGGTDWWVKLASALPLLVLLGGLMLIQQWHTRAQITVAADIDAALLADDVPPNAYSDPGFVEFLKTPRD
jgi:hypothetical protein